MGAVYRVRHKLLDTDFALKVIHPRFASRADFLARFQREAQITAKLAHENIAPVTDAGVTDEGLPYYVMKYLHGKPLGLILKQQERTPGTGGRLELRYALEIGELIFNTLGFAHRQNVIHRDIKPDNVFIHTKGPIWFLAIVDFGIAKVLAETGSTGNFYLGTLAYSAREHLMSSTAPNPSWDVYSATVILYRMLTGKHPFAAYAVASRDNGIAEAICAPNPPRAPSITQLGEFPFDLAALVARGLSHDAAERPDAAVFGMQLHDIRRRVIAAAPSSDLDTNATVEDLSTTIHTLASVDNPESDREIPAAPPAGAQAVGTPATRQHREPTAATRPHANFTQPDPSLGVALADTHPSDKEPQIATAVAPPPASVTKPVPYTSAEPPAPRIVRGSPVVSEIPIPEVPQARAGGAPPERAPAPPSWEPPRAPVSVDRDAVTNVPASRRVAVAPEPSVVILGPEAEPMSPAPQRPVGREHGTPRPAAGMPHAIGTGPRVDATQAPWRDADYASTPVPASGRTSRPSAADSVTVFPDTPAAPVARSSSSSSRRRARSGWRARLVPIAVTFVPILAIGGAVLLFLSPGEESHRTAAPTTSATGSGDAGPTAAPRPRQ